MRSFDELYQLAAEKKGGEGALNALLPEPLTDAMLAVVPDDRWLAGMTKSVFQAGFNWSVIEKKWPGFEEAFHGFDPGYCSMLSDEDIDALMQDKRVVRNAQKIMSVRANAMLIRELAEKHGRAGAFFASWPASDFIGLLDELNKRGDRLGPATAQYFLRFIGKDSFILSKDVKAALIREGVIDKEPKSKAAMRAVQDAFNAWAAESRRPIAHVSRVLAATV